MLRKYEYRVGEEGLQSSICERAGESHAVLAEASIPEKNIIFDSCRVRKSG